MQLGMIGLGRMGSNMTRRLLRHGQECVVYDVRAAASEKLAGEGARGAGSLSELVQLLDKPRTIWIMAPAAAVDSTLRELAPLLERDDIVIDGGNSHYHDDLRRAAELAPRGIHYVDVGTSGGVWGLERGYCLMIGGDEAAVRRLEPIFAALAPGNNALAPGNNALAPGNKALAPGNKAPDTPGRAERGSTAEQGYLHCGPSGAGHFVKMVHNGIEYGLMAAYAEGLNVLRHAGVGNREAARDAETAPLRHPEHYRYEFDLADIAEVWRRGSVIASWLLDLAARALADSPDLAKYAGRVSDSGEGRWTVAAAIDESVPTPVLSAALFARFSSRGEEEFADKLLSALRYEFGGHLEKRVTIKE